LSEANECVALAWDPQDLRRRGMASMGNQSLGSLEGFLVSFSLEAPLAWDTHLEVLPLLLSSLFQCLFPPSSHPPSPRTAAPPDLILTISHTI